MGWLKKNLAVIPLFQIRVILQKHFPLAKKISRSSGLMGKGVSESPTHTHTHTKLDGASYHTTQLATHLHDWLLFYKECNELRVSYHTFV